MHAFHCISAVFGIHLHMPMSHWQNPGWYSKQSLWGNGANNDTIIRPTQFIILIYIFMPHSWIITISFPRIVLREQMLNFPGVMCQAFFFLLVSFFLFFCYKAKLKLDILKPGKC